MCYVWICIKNLNIYFPNSGMFALWDLNLDLRLILDYWLSNVSLKKNVVGEYFKTYVGKNRIKEAKSLKGIEINRKF